MKKAIAVLLIVFLMSVVFSSCCTCKDECCTFHGQTENTEQTVKEPTKNNSVNKEEKPADAVNTGKTKEEIVENAEKEFDEKYNALYAEWEALSTKITSFDVYTENVEEIEAFYKKVYETTATYCKDLYYYTLSYAQLILSSESSYSEKRDEFGDIYDLIYDDMTEKVYDDIYDGLLQEMYNTFYDGIIDEASDSVNSSLWYDVRSDEYSLWYDARSDVYSFWYDTKGDIYSFIYDIQAELWDQDDERIEKQVEEFRSDIEKIRI